MDLFASNLGSEYIESGNIGIIIEEEMGFFFISERGQNLVKMNSK